MNSRSNELAGVSFNSTANSNSRDLSKVLIGALAGAAAGSIIGGLFTEKGMEARKRVSESSKNMANTLKDKVSGISESIADRYEAANESAAHLKKSAAYLIKKGKQKVERISNNTAHKSTAGAGAKSTGSTVALGALAVSVAGLIIWSFTAEKGIKTRMRLGKGTKNMAKNLKEKVTNIADGVADTYDAAKEGAADLIEKGRQQADTLSDGTAYNSFADADM